MAYLGIEGGGNSMVPTDYMFVFPREYLRPALVTSLLSVWVLVGVCFYLNFYTRRRYFTIWSAAWLFYALWLTLALNVPSTTPSPVFLMLKQFCVGIAATFMLWGAATFLNQRASDRIFGLFLGFLMVWSYVTAFYAEANMWVQLPVFGLIGLGSGFSAFGFYRFRDLRLYRGASLLSVGFFLWGAYLACYPIWESSEEMVSSGFFISAVLQLFIAVSMIILVLEEARVTNAQAQQQLEQQKSESAGLRTKILSTEERYRSLFSQASEAIVITAADDLRILELNEAARRLLGTGPGDHRALVLTTFLRLNLAGDAQPTTGPEWYAALCQHRRIQIVHPDGSAIPAEVSGAPVDFQGVTTYQFFFRELTEKARLEEQLRQAEKLSALGQMISGIAHELNNPLAVIKGYLDLILSRHDIAKQTRVDLEKVVHESDRAAKLVSNFLSFARKRPSRRRGVQINEIIHRVIELREVDIRISGVQPILSLDPDLPITLADPDQLEQVLVNLVTNALHALVDCAGPRVVALTTEQREGGLLVRVEDSGPGVPPNVLPHIFEPFFTTKEVGSGTGLGLSIAHSIITEHGGKVYYERSARGGAAFVIELPVIPAGPEDLEDPDLDAGSDEPCDGPKLGGQFEPTGARILVVDDEQVLAELLAELLAALGHEAVTCCSALRALELMEVEEFDLILSDFRMPIMNGREFFERVTKTRPELAKRIVFLTGDVVTPETRAFMEGTGNPHLPKPFRLDSVGRVVAETMRKNGVVLT